MKPISYTGYVCELWLLNEFGNCSLINLKYAQYVLTHIRETLPNKRQVYHTI